MEELIGETIKTAEIVCHLKSGCDGENLLVLETKHDFGNKP